MVSKKRMSCITEESPSVTYPSGEETSLTWSRLGMCILLSSPRTGWSEWGREDDSAVGELELRGEKDPSEWREQRGKAW